MSSRPTPMVDMMTHSRPSAFFRTTRMPLISLAALLMATSALCLPGLAFAAQAGTQVQAGRVDRIVIRGNERIEQGTILTYLPIQPGSVTTEEQRGSAVNALFQSGLFANVEISLQGTDLIVSVVENPIINRVIFEGDRALKEDKLRDEVTVRPRSVFTRARVQQDVQRIIELYRRSGRISATVTPKIVELPQKRIDLIFEIDEGPKSGVLDINFVGNSEFSDNDLRDVIVTERSTWYKFFSTNDNYDPDRINYDEEELRDYYRNRGYYAFRILSSVAELKPERNAFVLTFTIDEGKQYRFGKMTVKTELRRLDGDVLQRLLPIHEGDLYRQDAMDAARDALTYQAGAVGFAFVNIRPTPTVNPETGRIDIEFEVSEGPRVYVERVDIVGNTQTLDRVIRREMSLAEGDAFNRSLVDRSKNRIRALRFFKDVNIEEGPGSAPDKTTLRVTVEEQPTGELAFSAGYSSIDGLVLDGSIIQSNFRGRGQNVRARISAGAIRQNLDLSFTEPRFMGRNLSAGVDVYSYRYDYSTQVGYIATSTGVNFRTQFNLGLNSSVGLRYNIRSDAISVDGNQCSLAAAPTLCSQLGSKFTSLVGYNWYYDQRNDATRPTRGYNLAISQDFAGVGGDISYLRTEVTGNWHHGFSKSFIFTASAQTGYITGFGGDSVRINERFFKGGNSFRGFETAGIGPRDDVYRSALGGKLYAIGTFELTLPTFLPEQYGVKASLFSDFGTLGLLDDADKVQCNAGTPPICFPNFGIKDDLSLRASAGITIGWKSPLGPIQFDFSQILAREPYDRPESFRFSTSTRF